MCKFSKIINIFYVSFILLNELTAAEDGDPSFETFMEDIRNAFEDKSTTRNGIIRFSSLERLTEVSDEFKMACLQAYKISLAKATSANKKPQLAFEALETTMKEIITKNEPPSDFHKMGPSSKRIFYSPDDKALYTTLSFMKSEYNLIPFIAYLNNHHIPEADMETEINHLQTKTKSKAGYMLTADEARFRIILKKFNMGCPRTDYPKSSAKTTLKMPKMPQMPQMPSGVMNVFKSKEKKVIRSKL